MKTTLLTGCTAILAIALSVPAVAFDIDTASAVSEKAPDSVQAATDEFDRRGRGRGGRSKPRIPGGSGCDDPGDILEHPECAG